MVTSSTQKNYLLTLHMSCVLFLFINYKIFFQRFKSKIEEKMTSTEETTTADQHQEALQVYHKEASELLLRPDQLFKFTVISTLTCQNCGKISATPESYLDLSLSIMPEITEETKIITKKKKVQITKKVKRKIKKVKQMKKIKRKTEKQNKKDKEIVNLKVNDKYKDSPIKTCITNAEYPELLHYLPRRKSVKDNDIPEMLKLAGFNEFDLKCAQVTREHSRLAFDELIAPGEKSAVQKLMESWNREIATIAADIAAAAENVENEQSESEMETEKEFMLPLISSSR